MVVGAAVGRVLRLGIKAESDTPRVSGTLVGPYVSDDCQYDRDTAVQLEHEGVPHTVRPLSFGWTRAHKVRVIHNILLPGQDGI